MKRNNLQRCLGGATLASAVWELVGPNAGSVLGRIQSTVTRPLRRTTLLRRLRWMQESCKS
jgi:hypothetical protein